MSNPQRVPPDQDGVLRHALALDSAEQCSTLKTMFGDDAAELPRRRPIIGPSVRRLPDGRVSYSPPRCRHVAALTRGATRLPIEVLHKDLRNAQHPRLPEKQRELIAHIEAHAEKVGLFEVPYDCRGEWNVSRTRAVFAAMVDALPDDARAGTVLRIYSVTHLNQYVLVAESPATGFYAELRVEKPATAPLTLTDGWRGDFAKLDAEIARLTPAAPQEQDSPDDDDDDLDSIERLARRALRGVVGVAPDEPRSLLGAAPILRDLADDLRRLARFLEGAR